MVQQPAHPDGRGDTLPPTACLVETSSADSNRRDERDGHEAHLVHLVPLTIVVATIVPGAAHAQTPLACEFLAGLKIDNVNESLGLRTCLHTAAYWVSFAPRLILIFACPPRTGMGSSSWQVVVVSAAPDSDRAGFTNAMNYGLRRNYAVSAMDAGHWVSQCWTDAGLTTIALPRSTGAAAPLQRRRKSQRRLSAPSMTNRKRSPISPAARPRSSNRNVDAIGQRRKRTSRQAFRTEQRCIAAWSGETAIHAASSLVVTAGGAIASTTAS